MTIAIECSKCMVEVGTHNFGYGRRVICRETCDKLKGLNSSDDIHLSARKISELISPQDKEDNFLSLFLRKGGHPKTGMLIEKNFIVGSDKPFLPDLLNAIKEIPSGKFLVVCQFSTNTQYIYV